MHAATRRLGRRPAVAAVEERRRVAAPTAVSPFAASEEAPREVDLLDEFHCASPSATVSRRRARDS
jgi:hypothetical protein